MTMEFGDDLLAIVGIALDGCGGLMDGCGRAARCQERCSNTNFGCCLGSRNRFDGTVIRLEGCPKDDVVDGSKIGRVLGVWEKKNDKEVMPSKILWKKTAAKDLARSKITGRWLWRDDGRLWKDSEMRRTLL
ncbi:hypothetical protein BHE74_00029148 [Ensete ventricosum]|nr:hypothetical protein BHE74_00029148 [Ensete ventricosum]